MELAGIIVTFVIVTGMIVAWLYDYFKDEEGEDEWLGFYSVVSLLLFYLFWFKLQIKLQKGSLIWSLSFLKKNHEGHTVYHNHLF